MVFSSPDFLFFFLPTTLIVYFVVPNKARNLILMLASFFFYTAGGGLLVVLLIISTVTDYAAGRVVAKGLDTGQDHLAKWGVVLSVLVNLALLGYFKYANFLVDQLNSLARPFNIGEIAWTTVILPIGISFYTFQSMSYTIDVYRSRVRPVSSLWDFALYVSLFPQLVAGPIVRFHEIDHEIRNRKSTTRDFAEGAVRFMFGLMKKVVIADSVALIAESTFSLPTGRLTTAGAWLGVLAYTVQIYFDFSGYSDMAIGLGRMFGFTFPENFRRPYSALSITDFWRRWHVTLSNWFRDYLYVPLGGSHGDKVSTYRNLGLVFLITGLWHGANWTYVVWGAYHGVLLIIERVTNQRPVGDHAPGSWIRRALTFFAVVIGWVLFRAESVSQAWEILGTMFSANGATFPAEIAVAMTTRAQVGLIVGLAATLIPRHFVTGPWLARSSSRLAGVGRLALAVMATPYVLALVSSGSFSPFLYYQF